MSRPDLSYARHVRRFAAGVAAASLAFLALATSGSPVLGADRPSLTFGIVPQQSASRLAEIWVPFLDSVAGASGIRLEFKTNKDIPTFESCLAAGRYDVAYMNPYHYTVFHEVGYEAFAHAADATLQGIIVVRADQPFNSLADLDGRKLAFPSPAALGASVLPRAELRKQGIRFEPSYLRSHDSVYRAVASGLFSAGGGVARTFATVPDEVSGALRVIHTTERYTAHAFAAHGRVSADAVDAVRRAMVGIADTAPGVLEPLGMKGFVAAADAEWNDIRSIGLTPADTGIVDNGSVTCPSD
jgi:phosphonate transport system substrate-binding protein